MSFISNIVLSVILTTKLSKLFVNRKSKVKFLIEGRHMKSIFAILPGFQ